jgi:pilus assembly protein Flp/PilA
MFKRFMSDESGQDLIEYALLAALIALVAVAAIRLTGTTLDGVWDRITTALTGV